MTLPPAASPLLPTSSPASHASGVVEFDIELERLHSESSDGRSEMFGHVTGGVHQTRLHHSSWKFGAFR